MKIWPTAMRRVRERSFVVSQSSDERKFIKKEQLFSSKLGNNRRKKSKKDIKVGWGLGISKGEDEPLLSFHDRGAVHLRVLQLLPGVSDWRPSAAFLSRLSHPLSRYHWIIFFASNS